MDTLSQKKFISANCKKLTKQDAIDVGKTLIRYGKAESIIYTSEGASINLDLLGKEDDTLIGVLYAQVKHKLDKTTKV